MISNPSATQVALSFRQEGGDTSTFSLQISRRKLVYVLEDLEQIFTFIENEKALEKHLVGFFSYESASFFDPALRTYPYDGKLPLAAFYSGDLIETEFPQSRALTKGSTVEPTCSEEDFKSKISQIKYGIENGDFYQINYTFPNKLGGTLRPSLALGSLASPKQGGYQAFFNDDDWEILSLSPELFFEVIEGKIRTSPMKGTRPKSGDLKNDQQSLEELATSPKDRAENVMIVDLLRNDLGRVCKTGTVKVTDLFKIEEYETVFQMISTIEGELEPTVSLKEIMTAIFPCGSVTGAPKIEAMKNIVSLESGARGVYCGAIGWIKPNGDMTFNVPIRTLIQNKGQTTYSTGAGIVYDSDPLAEYEECKSKAAVLNKEVMKDFYLFETIRWEGHSIYLYEYHKVRLENTARQWGIQFSKDKFNNIISEIMNKLDEQMKRVKLSLHGNGEFTYEIFPFQLAENTIQEVILAPTPISSLDPFLRYKTSERSLYNKYRKLLKPNQEIILHNEFGEITEGSISNIILDIDGNLCTPTVDSGLLAGTYRQWMIDQGKLIERKLYLNDLYSAAKIYLCNGLRGMWEVSLKEEQRK